MAHITKIGKRKMAEKKNDVVQELDFGDVYELLNHIQTHLKAPKNRHNHFGGFNYRNAEDILEAVKTHLHGATLILQDEVLRFEDRFYVRTTVTLSYKKNQLVTCAFSREPTVRKGMDESQITGASATYAAKRALGNLFLLDDTRDADSDDNRGESANHAEGGPGNAFPVVAPTQSQQKKVWSQQKAMVNEINECVTREALVSWWGVNEIDINEMPLDEAQIVRDQYENRLVHVEGGKAKKAWRWEKARDQDLWVEEAKGHFDRCSTKAELDEMQSSVQHKIDALEFTRKKAVIDHINARLAKIAVSASAPSNLKAG